MPAVLDPPRPLSRLRREFPELEKEVPALVAALKEGLPADRVEKLRASLEVTTGHIAKLLGIPSSTLSRRRRAGRLGRDESERAYRVARLLERTTEVFGTLAQARAWLKQPQYALGGQVPLAFSDTEPGAREVEDLLGRIEHGIPA